MFGIPLAMRGYIDHKKAASAAKTRACAEANAAWQKADAMSDAAAAAAANAMFDSEVALEFKDEAVSKALGDAAAKTEAVALFQSEDLSVLMGHIESFAKASGCKLKPRPKFMS